MRLQLVRRIALIGMLLVAPIAVTTGAADDADRASPTDPKPVDYPTWETVEPGAYHGYNRRASLLQRGKAVYATYCVGCHGVAGDGKGPAARRLITKPRDFTSGTYKFRSTDSSSLPLEADIYRTITRGLSRVSMPGFPLMPERDKLAVIEYIKSFYPDWDDEKGDRVVVPIPRAPGDLASAERIGRGRIVYTTMQCYSCHGVDGAGRGATEKEFTDHWGNKQKPFDFTRGALKAGDDPEDIYRTFHAGLVSVMPSYGGLLLASANAETFASNKHVLEGDELVEAERYVAEFPIDGAAAGSLAAADANELATRNSWDLVAFIISLRKDVSTARAVLGGGE